MHWQNESGTVMTENDTFEKLRKVSLIKMDAIIVKFQFDAIFAPTPEDYEALMKPFGWTIAEYISILR